MRRAANAAPVPTHRAPSWLDPDRQRSPLSTVEREPEHEVAGHATFGGPHDVPGRARKLRPTSPDAVSRHQPARRGRFAGTASACKCGAALEYRRGNGLASHAAYNPKFADTESRASVKSLDPQATGVTSCT